MNEPTTIAGATPPEPEVDYVSLKAGQTIGRYEIVSVLGQGGFGITYRARDVQLGREVAIKEYLPSALAVRQDGSTVLPRTTKMADDFGWGRDRFVTEGRTLASLHRVPAIVQVFDFLEANGTAYIVMELLSGATLEDRINNGGRLKPEEVDRILWPLLDGLEQVHAAGFLHRDIKPANILLDAAGNPTLIDFGASRAAMVGRTAAMTAIFTPGYAAAEQMTSAKQGPWTDIYGLSATIYHAIAGKAPPNAFDRMLDDCYEPLARIASPGFSPGLLAGIDAGLTVAARDRPQSIAGWRPILGMTSAPEPGATMVMGKADDPPAGRVSVLGPATPPVAADAPLPPPTKSKAGLWAGIAVVLLLALGGGGYYAMATRGPDPEMVKARAAAESAEEARRQAAEEADKLRAEKAEQDAKAKAEQEARAKANLEAKQKADAEAARRQFEEDTRRKVENEIAEKKRADEEAQRQAAEEAAARQKAIEDARKATEFVAGNFDHFGKTLMLIGLKDRSGEIRLQGVDSVDDPALHKLAADALATQPRNLRCRQTDRLTDGTPLYRCLITRRTAKDGLADIPDSDRDDLALVLVRTGLLLASCDAPRSYADAEDEARGSKQYLWSRVTVPDYKRRCTR
ncbi:protein kinase [Reyranella sp. MMS21-HV4-11]|uniref:Protein kinase n=1 Tax=Reyranella humidisoli TaxID=2849149 RepID=A0ABS6IKG4_9HYPH|nr:protein kinase [Reyranella sp. MMS21-HV4-11]MBU8875093.1 protein kinase [Reyranella sp. MMS21-HV4-11]